MKQDGDETIAQLLRVQPEPGLPAGPCLDAEIVAAWFDGTLMTEHRRDAERHVATCARCQTLLATMAQVEPVNARSPRSLPLVRWLAPALAAAAAVFVWVSVAPRSADVPSVPSVIAPAAHPSLNAPAPSPPSANAPGKHAGATAVDEPANVKPAPAPKALIPSQASQPPVSRPEAEAAAAPSPAAMAEARAQLKDEADAALQRDALAASSPTPPIVRSADGLLWRLAGDGTLGGIE